MDKVKSYQEKIEGLNKQIAQYAKKMRKVPVKEGRRIRDQIVQLRTAKQELMKRQEKEVEKNIKKSIKNLDEMHIQEKKLRADFKKRLERARAEEMKNELS